MAIIDKAGACVALAGILLLGGSAQALSPADTCEASKLRTAGNYDLCRLKAESKAVKIGGVPNFSNCDDQYALKWLRTEINAHGACLSNGDQAAVQAFITEYTDALEAALDGGTLPEGFAVGTAGQADVLSGKTFSSSAGLGLTGTMPNDGAVNITPGTTSQTIAAGYHNGLGAVAGDANLVAGNIREGVSIFGVAGTLPLSGILLATGQTTSYGAGSDGDLQMGASHSFIDNGDGTITDNTTGLMWEKKDQSHGIHHSDDVYTWGMISSPYTMNGTMVTSFLATLNAGGGFAGHTDWRIPNLNELQSIANYQNANPAVEAAFNTACAASCTVTSCSCTAISPGAYFSSTTYQAGPPGPQGVWLVDFYAGVADWGYKSGLFYVRAVRGGS